MVGIPAGENLCLRFQTAKGAGMDDTITVALKVVAIRMRRLGMAASAGVFYADRIVGEHGESLALRILECCPINIQTAASHGSGLPSYFETVGDGGILGAA